MIDTRKQAENGFGEGLIMDTSPLNQSNNSLTNCLNGTTVTYNGNEFILLNDMGNGRVESAFLPAGYVPVGMKEYGGIIYIASYNPLTNKGLIGSFPSPERTLADNELGNPNLVISNDLFGFNESGYNKFYAKLKILNNEEDIIRPGDSFSLEYIGNDSSLPKILTNFNNSLNKLFRIGVAVMDSEGNLNDITDLLKHSFEDSNIDYFIQPYQQDASGHPTVDDIRKSVKHANIYGGRLSGKLFLTVEINTPIEYELEIDGEKIAETYKINFKGVLKDTIEDNYFLGVKVNLNGDTFYILGGSKVNKDINHDFTVSDLMGKELTYAVTPCMHYGELKAFTKRGTLDLSLLNSGLVELTEWKYYNDFTNDTLHLNWGLVTYLRNKEYIKAVKFDFYKYDPINKTFNLPIIILTDSRKNYTGNFTEEISYDNLEKGCMYLVLIHIEKTFKGGSEINSLDFYRILYTSTYFNTIYNSDISDFKSETLEASINTNVSIEPLTTTKFIVNEDKSATILDALDPNPNFYIKHGEETSLKASLKVSYDIDNEYNLPFSLNKEYTIKPSKYTNKSSCLVENISKYDSLNLSNSTFEIDKLQNNKIPQKSEKPVEEKYKFWFVDSVKDGIINLTINTVTEFKGNPVKDTVNSNKRNYIPYLNEFTVSSNIFGLDLNTLNRGFTTRFGGRTDSESEKRCFANFITVKNWSDSINSQDVEIIGNNMYPNDLTGYGSNKQPDVEDFLNNILPMNYKNSVDKTLPVIQFWIGADALSERPYYTDIKFWKNRNSGKVNYMFIVWKDSNNRYFLINNVFNTNISSVSNLKLQLKNLFNNLYIEQNYSFSKQVFRTGNYYYIQDYDVIYNSEYNIENLIYNKDILIELNENTIGDIINFNKNSIINSIPKNLNINSDIINTCILPNITVSKLNLNSKNKIELTKKIKGGDINNLIPQYLVQDNSNLDKALITFEGSSVSNIIFSDFQGLPLDKKIYYLDKNNKVYPVQNSSGYSNSNLATIISEKILNNIDTMWDPNKMYNLIVILPNDLISLPYDTYTPSIGTPFGVGDNTSEKYKGYMKFKSNKIINFKFLNTETIQ